MLMPALGAMPLENPQPGADDRWRYFTSPNFELYSRSSEGESRALLHNLELFRAFFLGQLKLEERLHVPVTVYSFRNERDFQAYLPAKMRGSKVTGFHQWQPDRAVIAMAPTEDDEEARHTIFHEYVHHLFRVAEKNPPLWFNEGTAELMASLTVERGAVQIGSPLEGRTVYLRQEKLMPLEQLFEAEFSKKLYQDETHTGVFYAESWALLHYWRFGDSGLSPEAVQKYLTIASDREAIARTNMPQLFRATFGCDYAEMRRRLEEYIRRGHFQGAKYPEPKIEPASTYAVRAVPIEEINVRLAELSLRADNSAIARLVLLNALHDRPQDSRPPEALGAAAMAGGDEQETRERWEAALAAGSQNPSIFRELALMEGRHWFEQFDDTFRIPRDTLDRVRSRLLVSIEKEPRQSAAFEMLAWAEGFAEAPDAENINRVIAQLPTMADKSRTVLGLVQLMLRLGKPEDALVMLNYLSGRKLNPFDTRAVDRLTSKLAEQFPAVAKELNQSTSSATVVAPPKEPGLKMPSVSLPDDL